MLTSAYKSYIGNKLGESPLFSYINDMYSSNKGKHSIPTIVTLSNSIPD